jgi:ABC-2 type transport system ATP-binding protein
MIKRAALARAVVMDPKLLFCDEPSAGLDPVGCREVKDMVRMLSANGVSVLMTSHLLSDVEDICDRVAVLARGELRASGRISELLRQPDAVRYLVEGLSDEENLALRKSIENQIGRPVQQDYPAMSLEAFFLQVIAEDGEKKAYEIAPFLQGK